MSQKEKIEIMLDVGILTTIKMLANAKNISVENEIENILEQHFSKSQLVGIPNLVGTEIQGTQLQADKIVKINGVLYFYQLVDTKLKSHATYVIADVTNQKVYLVAKGDYHAWN